MSIAGVENRGERAAKKKSGTSVQSLTVTKKNSFVTTTRVF